MLAPSPKTQNTLLILVMITVWASANFVNSNVCNYWLLIGARPTMDEIRRFRKTDGRVIDLVTEIGTDYKKIGRILLESDRKVANIETSKQGHVENIVDEILREWLKGSGRTPVTWETLVTVLRESGLVVLADDINDSLYRFCLF